jgi:methylphosphotriester-DNA--protein-cysteine methyltransferase
MKIESVIKRFNDDNAKHNKIKQRKIRFGGNLKLKIYGTLSCASGKRMKRENRVFFLSENEAIEKGFRPCGYCMKEKYQKWKNGFI